AAFSWNHMNIDTINPALPERLVEVELLAGWAGRLDAQWQLGVFGGLGYAGNNAFGDHEAYYALADVVLDYSLDDVSDWQFFLSYKGNRAYLPDVPLPAVAYYNRRNDALHYALGLPASSVVWRPAAQWTVHGRYLLPITVEAAVEYALASR